MEGAFRPVHQRISDRISPKENKMGVGKEIRRTGAEEIAVDAEVPVVEVPSRGLRGADPAFDLPDEAVSGFILDRLQGDHALFLPVDPPARRRRPLGIAVFETAARGLAEARHNTGRRPPPSSRRSRERRFLPPSGRRPAGDPLGQDPKAAGNPPPARP